MRKLYSLLLLVLVLSLSLTACCGVIGKVREKAVEKAVELEATAEEVAAEAIEPTATPITEPTLTPVLEEEREETPLPTVTPTSVESAEEEETPLPTPTPLEVAEEEFEVAEIPGWIETYRTLLTMGWEGTEEGETTSGSVEIRGEHIITPSAEHIFITSAEEGEEPQTMEWIAIEKTTWLNTGEGWMQMQTDEMQTPSMFGLWDTGELFGGMEGYRRIRPDEEVNNLACEHYAFDESALTETIAESMGGVTAASGEAWISKKDHFVVKCAWHVEGKEVGPEGGQGAADWAWEIRDINAPITIEPPISAEEIGGETGKLPMMPDAQVTMAVAGMTTYTTDSSLEDVVAFYETEMPTAGWAQEGETTQTEDLAMMEFSKEEQSASVVITAEEGEGSQVMLTVE